MKDSARFMGELTTDGLDIFAGFDDIVQENLAGIGLAARFDE